MGSLLQTHLQKWAAREAKDVAPDSVRAALVQELVVWSQKKFGAHPKLNKAFYKGLTAKLKELVADAQNPATPPIAPLKDVAETGAQKLPLMVAATTPSGAAPTLLDLYSFTRVDTNILKLESGLGEGSLRKNLDSFTPAARVTHEGYLIVIERDVEGNFQRAFPVEPGLQKARVSPNQPINLSEFKFDAAGTEVFKAFWTADADAAQKLLDSFLQIVPERAQSSGGRSLPGHFLTLKNAGRPLEALGTTGPTQELGVAVSAAYRVARASLASDDAAQPAGFYTSQIRLVITEN